MRPSSVRGAKALPTRTRTTSPARPGHVPSLGTLGTSAPVNIKREIDDDGDTDDDLIQEDNDPSGGICGEDSVGTGKIKIRKPKFFRPTSAPAAHSHNINQLPVEKGAHEHASMSIEYLRVAAEKKKAKDKEFEYGLKKEMMEEKKKLQMKLEQANTMAMANGSKQSYIFARDRDGMNAVKVLDPYKGDRLLSTNAFFREFEKLASLSLGQQEKKKPTISQIKEAAERKSKLDQKLRLSRGSITTFMSLLADEEEMPDQSPPAKAHTSRIDESAKVQEELQAILADTVQVTNAIQNQLHELKLKGWNFTARRRDK